MSRDSHINARDRGLGTVAIPKTALHEHQSEVLARFRFAHSMAPVSLVETPGQAS